MSATALEPQRATPLAEALAQRIAVSGPISVSAYMTACLADPQHGYYRAQQAIGGAGDFITAPEISQVFGELLGLWSAVVWQQMGQPSAFQLVEVGPGRGTMMADALRAAARVPGFAQAVRVVLVEPSPVLRQAQEHTLARAAMDVRWLERLDQLVPAATVLLANEFLDVLPVDQLVRHAGEWRVRTVGRDASGGLAFGLGDAAAPAAWPDIAAAAPEGAILELRDLAPCATALARVAVQHPLAALFIDYGHEATGFGDTLQAVRRHRPEHPLTSPGEADLTAMVDFEAVARAFSRTGLVCERLTTQAELLGALGIAERASRLMSANPARAGEIEMGIGRLMSPQGMGTRFKALGVRSPALPPLPGFPLR
jgi:SAM-dependent MidA family methyltransferase